MPLVTDATGNTTTYAIIGAAMTVHNTLGPGLKEEVYEKALAVELTRRGLDAQAQVPVDVWYDNEQVGIFYLDLLVEDQVVVELKAFPHLLTDDELGQVLNYLKVSQRPVGLLINFGRRRLDYRRVFPLVDQNEQPHRTGRDALIR